MQLSWHRVPNNTAPLLFSWRTRNRWETIDLWIRKFLKFKLRELFTPRHFLLSFFQHCLDSRLLIWSTIVDMCWKVERILHYCFNWKKNKLMSHTVNCIVLDGFRWDTNNRLVNWTCWIRHFYSPSLLAVSLLCSSSRFTIAFFIFGTFLHKELALLYFLLYSNRHSLIITSYRVSHP
jgi:hypothetical protein